MSHPWERPIDPAGYRTLSPADQERVARQRAEAFDARFRLAVAGRRQAQSRLLIAEGRLIAAGGAR